MSLRQERGISTVITALLFPVILLFFSGVLDAGSILLTRRQLQVAADAAAAAGVAHFEVFGELQGSVFVPRVRITSGAASEANTAINLNITAFNFATRGIVIIENTQTGIGTSSYTVTLRARVPTLLMGQMYNAFRGGTGQYNTVIIHAVSTAQIII